MFWAVKYINFVIEEASHANDDPPAIEQATKSSEEDDDFLDDLFEDSDDTELETTPAIERTHTVSDVKHTGFLQATESTVVYVAI